MYFEGDLKKQFVGPVELRGTALTVDGEFLNSYFIFVTGFYNSTFKNVEKFVSKVDPTGYW